MLRKKSDLSSNNAQWHFLTGSAYSLPNIIQNTYFIPVFNFVWKLFSLSEVHCLSEVGKKHPMILIAPQTDMGVMELSPLLADMLTYLV